ncbi:MOSC domain-containing protein [Nocardioides ferulae]|uniref:MOSC domain-containing protein n=1 Tax=Nocardioides ferulae TaxID=2340821 RepID=UPI000EB4DAC8|nr:MOSC N-terminal beta barrel domain-containing protein [Nocardioides ferulae]
MQTAGAQVGTVVRVGFAPMKGVRHTAYDVVRLDAHGPVGDRELCLVDVVAQRVLKTARHPELVAVTVRRDGDRVEVTLPDGAVTTTSVTPTPETLSGDYWGRRVRLTLLQGPLDGVFSDYLGMPVRLAAASRPDIVYGAEVSLVATASLHALGEHAGHPALADQAARFRPTFVLDLGDQPHVEDTWVGRELTVGEARIRLHEPIPRCTVVDLDPVTGVKDARVLKALAGYRPRDGAGDLLFGFDAQMVTPGDVRPGDPVLLH